MGKRITANMIVKNEDRFIWYAINSVLPYVERFLIFDTGSTDKTIPIIRSISSEKIVFEKRGEVGAKGLVSLRNEQIRLSKTNWIWIVDGDEVYPKKTAEAILKVTDDKTNYYGIIVHRYDLLGDIYHYQDEKVGVYNQFGKIGHYVLRLINKEHVAGLQVRGEYPNEYFADQYGESIKEKGREKFAFVEERIFHAMYLNRSTQKMEFKKILNRKGRKMELGKGVSESDLPEIFFQRRPVIVPTVTDGMDFKFKLLAEIITPFKKYKRKLASKI